MTVSTVAYPTSSTKKGKTMRYFLAILTLLFATTANSLTPDEVREQYPLVQQGICTDNVSGEQGRCYAFVHPDGLYVVFTQYGVPVFMRFATEDGYTEVWRASEAGAPQGIAL